MNLPPDPEGDTAQSDHAQNDHAQSYSASSAQRDLMAALAVTFMSVPQGIAYAMIAGLPPAVGLYAGAVPTIIGSLFRSSSHVITGPTNALSLLVGGAAIASAGFESPAMAAATLAILIGVIQVGAGALRLGAIVDFISSAVVLGYISGAGVLIGAGQLGNLTGTERVGGDLFSQLIGWVDRLDGVAGDGFTSTSAVNGVTLGIGLGTALAIVLMKRFTPRVPSAVVALAAGIALESAFGLRDGYGVKLAMDITPVPQGLPPLSIPTWTGLDQLQPLMALAFAGTVLSLVESSAVGRSIAAQTGQRLNTSRDFIGQGLANVAAGLFGGYPTSGSLSRSALNHRAGAITRMGGVYSGALMLAVLLVLGPLVDLTPITSLAGLLLVVAWELFDTPKIRAALRGPLEDKLAFLATLLGTWVFSLDVAIYLGVGVSLILFLRKSQTLVVHELIPDSADQTHRVSTRVISVEGALFFGAADELRRALDEHSAPPHIKTLIVHLERTRGLDLTTATVLKSTHQRLSARGQRLVCVGMSEDAMELLEALGVSELLKSPLPHDLILNDSIPNHSSKPKEHSATEPTIIGVVGWKNSGKTTLTARLVTELTQRGYHVSTVKHAHARFDVDHPGRDSYRHREAGALEVAIASPVRWAVMRELRDEPEPTLDEMIARMTPCDIIIVEGYKSGSHPKIEVRRHDARQRDPLAPNDPQIIAVASDSPVDEPTHESQSPPVFHLDDVSEIAEFLLTEL